MRNRAIVRWGWNDLSSRRKPTFAHSSSIFRLSLASCPDLSAIPTHKTLGATSLFNANLERRNFFHGGRRRFVEIRNARLFGVAEKLESKMDIVFATPTCT